MKKVVINILIVLVFILIYLLQVNFFSWFKIAGVMPNIFVILVLFIGLYFNKISGVTYGIVFGILLDLFIGKKVGPSAIMFGAIGLIGGIFDKNFSKESRITLMIMVLVSTAIYEIGTYILSYFIYQIDIQIIEFVKILLVECLYNEIIVIILYPLIQNFGYNIEAEYKENKILTRYF